MKKLAKLEFMQTKPAYWVYLFICLHLLCWTLVPALVRFNLPLDAIEGTIWGHQLEWGYDKNPFLNGWLTALAVQIHQSGWAVYLFSQLSVAAAFWVVWQLGKNILSPLYALIAVMLLEGLQYYNFHAIDFNDNTLELGLWALTIYCFYYALKKPRSVLAWIGVGCFAGFAMMAKYYTLALISAMFLYLLIDAENRKILKTTPPCLALITFLIISLPHIIWLFFHDFITVKYVFERAASKPSWTNHIVYPLQFAFEQLQVFLPAFILFSFLLIGKKPLLADNKIKISHRDKLFLFYVGLGPFLLTLILGFLFGIKLRAGWGMPLLTLWSIILLASIQPQISYAKFSRFLVIMVAFFSAILSGYYFSLVSSTSATSANFPGREIAAQITKTWHDQYHTKLVYVAGSRWVGGNIGFYSADHPAVFIEWEKRRAPWINLQDLQQKGAVFVWSITDNEIMPDAIRLQYPRLLQTEVITFAWKRNKHKLEPIRIGVAYLPPKM